MNEVTARWRVGYRAIFRASSTFPGDHVKARSLDVGALFIVKLKSTSSPSFNLCTKLLTKAKVEKGTRFTIDYKGIATQIQPHLATPNTIAAAVTTGSQQLQQVIDQIPRSVPLADKVWGFTSVGAFIGVSFMLLIFFALSGYAWKEKGSAEAKAALLEQQLTQKQATMKWLNDGYVDLKQDNPKAAQKYFPQ